MILSLEELELMYKFLDTKFGPNKRLHFSELIRDTPKTNDGLKYLESSILQALGVFKTKNKGWCLKKYISTKARLN